MIPAFQCPELRKHSGVGRFDLLLTQPAGYGFPWSTQPASGKLQPSGRGS